MTKLLTSLIILASSILAVQAQSSRANFQISNEATYGYLFSHMSDNGNWTAYAMSQDGIHFHDLLCGQAAFSDPIGANRDSYLCRTIDGKGFLMVAEVCDGVKFLQSEDLLNWTSIKPAIVACGASAPQVIWDADFLWADGSKGGYMVYFTINNNIQYCHIDATLQHITALTALFDWGYAINDVDINWVNGSYKLLASHNGNIEISSSDKLTGPWPIPAEDSKIALPGSKTGVSSFQMVGEDGWKVGYYQIENPLRYMICSSDANMSQFRQPQDMEGIYGPQQGSILRLTQAEYDKLQAWSDSLEPKYLEPNVNNPVFKGLHADPEVMYSKKTGKYYIYPTTDGSFGWHSFYFHCFSSSDLKSWKDEGIILDLRELDWGKEYAWAPSIIEKPVYGKNGKVIDYQYYYYFVANKSVGVAVSDRPEGPFKDALGKPLLEQSEINAPNQVIDPDIFQDPKTGKYYIYFGNSYLWMAELADDMISIVPGTMKELIPRRRIGKYHYLEGSHVFERNGLYYFTWSENITRSSKYCVRYLISDSPTELVRNGQPAKVEDQIILQQVQKHQIFGTGHHSVLNVPGTDEWHMVYHRFTRPEGVKMGLSGGYNREVCIDKMEFNEDGTIKPVIPTL